MAEFCIFFTADIARLGAEDTVDYKSQVVI